MNYAAVNTKAVAVYAKLLKPELPLQILAAGNYEDGIDIIRKEWGLSFSEDTHLLEVNVKMEEKVYNTLRSFDYFLQGSARYFFKLLEQHYEIQDIKRIFRAVYHGDNVDILRNSLLAFNPELLPKGQALTPEGLFKILESTPYGRMLSAYQDVSKDRISFYVEMELDRSYYENLAREAKNLGKKDRKVVLAMLNRHIDLLNIFYIYRAKKNYDIMKSEMENFVIRGGNIPKTLIDEWVYSDDVESLKNSVRHSSFAFLFQSERDSHMTDILASRDLSEMYRTYYKEERMSIGRIVALSILLRLEIRDVSTVLEGLRLGFGKDMIRELLTIPAKEGEVWQ
ncbi:MAG: V-type ATPase subunit [Peptoniphilus sp.]|nr:V-type ATPase subunit [Peptoniphilus sp.]MDD7363442.1 V-type ATPase subunit [Bacillota bacterium]MDY6044854.1 V-type ATPase subunit [Peptoniphilus sp.]